MLVIVYSADLFFVYPIYNSAMQCFVHTSIFFAHKNIKKINSKIENFSLTALTTQISKNYKYIFDSRYISVLLISEYYWHNKLTRKWDRYTERHTLSRLDYYVIMFVAYYDTGSCHWTRVAEALKIFLSKQKSTGKSDQKYSFSVKTNLYLFLATLE